MIKRIFLIIMLCLCGMVAVSAQGPGKHHGKDRQQMWKELQEFKIKFLAQEIDLKDDQKERFAELYNEMTQKRMDCFKETRSLEKKIKDLKDNASDEDYKAVSEAMDKARTQDAEIERQYDEKFSEFLTSKQLYKLKQAEGKFRDKMAEMRGKKGKHKKDK